MSLIGIAVTVKGKQRFVGKVGDRAGSRIFYREANYIDFFSYKYNSFGVDKEAADYVLNTLRADYMACYCKDTNDLYVISMPQFRKAMVADLGELPQYRIPVTSFKKYSDHGPVPFGYTRHVVKLCSTIPT